MTRAIAIIALAVALIAGGGTPPVAAQDDDVMRVCFTFELSYDKAGELLDAAADDDELLDMALDAMSPIGFGIGPECWYDEPFDDAPAKVAPTKPTIDYGTWLVKGEAFDDKIVRGLDGLRRAASRSSAGGINNNLKVIVKQHQKLVDWHKGKTPDACYQQDWSKNLKFAKAQLKKWQRTARLWNQRAWTAAGRSVKANMQHRDKWMDWYNDTPIRCLS